ncbi:MAG: SpoIIE family protein phosphatase, partial [Cytophagales bacterium]|nr:SpoIIE family protein phosphatase [Armatimonadota bacterium]
MPFSFVKVPLFMSSENPASPNQPDLAYPAQMNTSLESLVQQWKAQPRLPNAGGDSVPPMIFSLADADGAVVNDLILASPNTARLILDQAARESQKKLSDLEARSVQDRLLPRAVPSVPGFEFAGRYVPAGAVGGDYWSVKLYPEQNVVTCKLADVTGHGVGAAILMAAIKFVSGVLFRYSDSPAQVMERTNHSLLRETTPDKMATMVYA